MEPEAFSPPPRALCGQLGLILCFSQLQVSCHFGVPECLMGTKSPPTSSFSSSLPSFPSFKPDLEGKKEHLDVLTESGLYNHQSRS